MKTNQRSLGWALLLALLSVLNAQLANAFAQGTAFTYQGRLNSGANAAGGIYDMRFTIYDSTNSPGNLVAGPVTSSATAVSNGLFTVTLDFGAGVFTGADRWLEIGVRTNGAVSFTALTPRQQITATPYAVTAGNLTGTLPASQLSGVIPLAQLPSALMTNYSSTASLAGFFNGSFGGSFYGNGGGLTGLNPANLNSGTAAINITGNAATATTATTATNLTGNVADAQIPANVARLNGTNTFTGTNHFANVVVATNVNNIIAGVFAGNGAALTNLNTAQFAGVVLTNNQNGVNLSGTFSGTGTGVTNVNAATLNGLNATNFWQLGGNNVSSGQILGSTNFLPVEIWVNGIRALRMEPTANDAENSSIVNVVGGAPVNYITSGVRGSVIAGGGAGSYYGSPYSNSISADYSFLGGGWQNSIQNASDNSFLGGGYNNSIQPNAAFSFLGGGYRNTNGAMLSVVPGGDDNFAGGPNSFAAGHRAKANYQDDFVWADSQDTDFNSTANDQFLIRAQGGVGINTNNPAGAALNVNGTASLSGSLFMNAKDIQLRGDLNHGLGWYGLGKPFAGVALDGPVLYGWSGGGLGTLQSYSATNLALTWNATGNVTVNGALSTASLNVDTTDANSGALSPGIAFGAGATGEGIASKRTTGIGWAGLDFYTSSTLRLRINNNGNVGIGTTNNAYLLVVGSGASPAYCNGTTWQNGSDRNSKEKFSAINVREVLDKVSTLPITAWKYKVEADGTTHIGPMAQDFHEAFGLNGADDKHIATVDESGVALAAIQGLNQKLNEKDAEIQDLKQSVAELQAALEKLSKK